MHPNTALENPKYSIPIALIWAQCITFAMLYSVWAMREVMVFRRVALVLGALMALYPIYQCRSSFVKKTALPLWLLLGLFIWMTCHLYFFAQDYSAQLLEFQRIWKYAALGAIFALGLGISLASTNQNKSYWTVIYLGICSPLLIYFVKYALTIYGPLAGFTPPDYLQVYALPVAYYIPKTDYVAFCLPALAVSLGQIYNLLRLNARLSIRQYQAIAFNMLIVIATMLLFYVQNTWNGIAYSVICIGLFFVLALFKPPLVMQFWKKVLFVITTLIISSAVLYGHIQSNPMWRTLWADAKVGFQLDKYPQWKNGSGDKKYPANEFGQRVSPTTYERAAWLKAGFHLSSETPLGYGLIEDSFSAMAQAKWPDVMELSHSHSGWLDLLLGIGAPGLLCVMASMILVIWRSRDMRYLRQTFVFWTLTSNLLLWSTTEVSATITFCLLIFWVALACGLTIIYPAPLKECN